MLTADGRAKEATRERHLPHDRRRVGLRVRAAVAQLLEELAALGELEDEGRRIGDVERVDERDDVPVQPERGQNFALVLGIVRRRRLLLDQLDRERRAVRFARRAAHRGEGALAEQLADVVAVDRVDALALGRVRHRLRQSIYRTRRRRSVRAQLAPAKVRDRGASRPLRRALAAVRRRLQGGRRAALAREARAGHGRAAAARRCGATDNHACRRRRRVRRGSAADAADAADGGGGGGGRRREVPLHRGVQGRGERPLQGGEVRVGDPDVRRRRRRVGDELLRLARADAVGLRGARAVRAVLLERRAVRAQARRVGARGGALRAGDALQARGRRPRQGVAPPRPGAQRQRRRRRRAASRQCGLLGGGARRRVGVAEVKQPGQLRRL